MNSSDLIWLIALLISHFATYHMGVTHAEEDGYTPSDEAFVAIQCHAIDKQYELAKWRAEHEQTERTAESSD